MFYLKEHKQQRLYRRYVGPGENSLQPVVTGHAAVRILYIIHN